jgi:hypothetical protein
VTDPGRSLLVHPDAGAPGGIALSAEAVRVDARTLAMTYALTGDIASLRLPPPGPPERAEGLWRRTCFEAFVAAEGEDAYLELNLAPSRQWAAWRFGGYREGMAPAALAGPPEVAVSLTDAGFQLRAVVDLKGLALSGAPWRLGLSAVLEAADGTCSYWALAHAPGKPDFHHSSAFVVRLGLPERP